MRVAETKDVVLTSSTVAGSTESEYSSGSTYNSGNKVKVSFDSDGVTARTPVHEYESLTDTNTGNYPPDSPTQWSDLGASNRWKMFDPFLNTETESASNIVVELGSNRTDMVGLLNVTGSAVVFELWRGGVLIKSETVDLRILDSGPGWYSWLYGTYEYKTKAFWTYPKYTDATLKVTIQTLAGEAKCGALHYGTQVSFGTMRYGATVGIDDYSYFDVDTSGRISLAPGNYADRAEFEMWLRNQDIDVFKRKMTSLRGKLSLYDLNNPGSDYDSFRIYGIAGPCDVVLPGKLRSKVNVEIKGAT